MPKSMINHFAIQADYQKLALHVDQSVWLIETGNYAHPGDVPPACRLESAIGKMGIAHAHSSVQCPSYLVLHTLDDYALRTHKSAKTTRYLVDQLNHSKSIVLTPGGLWRTGDIIAGSITSVHTTPESQSLMSMFSRAIRKAGFSRVKAYWVGPEAHAIMQSGVRLTPDISSPREYDLHL